MGKRPLIDGLGEIAFLQARHANKGGQPSCSAHESFGGLGKRSKNSKEKAERTNLARTLPPFPPISTLWRHGEFCWDVEPMSSVATVIR
jgi:hypothetical protein